MVAFFDSWYHVDKMKKDTKLITEGRDPARYDGAVNAPAFRASTIAFDSVEEMEARFRERFDRPYYGLFGTPTTLALEKAIAGLENARFAVVTSSGMAAISGVLLSVLAPGDHLLMTDSVYAPARAFCDRFLARYGVETTYYDPSVGAGVSALFRPQTRLVFCESPGSLTFEVQDVPAISEAARREGVLVAIDNTWSGGLYFDALGKGADISIQAGTKYLVGHSDAMLGSIAVNERSLYEAAKETLGAFGFFTGSEEAYLALRGLRTLSVRLERHYRNALEVARWLEGRPEVERVLYPALPSAADHELWKRDFTGASGLFGVLLKSGDEKQVRSMVDGMKFFSLGFSWGGFESLILPTRRFIPRTAVEWTHEGPSLRLHIGLEDPDDLIEDLKAGLERLKA